MRLSLGSAINLDLIKAEQLTAPTTCYIILGERCENNCNFCSQGVSASRLSRLDWPETDEKTAIEKINQSDFSRVCLQCTSATIDKVNDIIGKIHKPLSVSYNFRDIDQVRKISPKADRLCIPLDAANEEIFRKMKHGDFKERSGLIKEAAQLFPGKTATHLIAGLGESEDEMQGLMRLLHRMGVGIGLFAFTPVKGTPMESMPQPGIGYYRRLQAYNYELWHGKLTSDAFRTSGCPSCNRPYYNESPAGTIYNYPRELTEDEYERCRKEMEAD